MDRRLVAQHKIEQSPIPPTASIQMDEFLIFRAIKTGDDFRSHEDDFKRHAKPPELWR